MSVELPAPSPALTLHQAAANLRTRAKAALAGFVSNEYWEGGWARGIENAVGGAEGELAALLSPASAVWLADALDALGSNAARHGTPLPAEVVTFAERLTTRESRNAELEAHA
ncbi:hypothetical protein ABZV65_19735 [Streptomyces bauhiniae]|uniref:hypothetical protein n=1 Tax=Streptomyces bauhiniae TaxID=2340725 RepID=UPI0033BB7390